MGIRAEVRMCHKSCGACVQRGQEWLFRCSVQQTSCSEGLAKCRREVQGGHSLQKGEEGPRRMLRDAGDGRALCGHGWLCAEGWCKLTAAFHSAAHRVGPWQPAEGSGEHDGGTHWDEGSRIPPHLAVALQLRVFEMCCEMMARRTVGQRGYTETAGGGSGAECSLFFVLVAHAADSEAAWCTRPSSLCTTGEVSCHRWVSCAVCLEHSDLPEQSFPGGVSQQPTTGGS